jgi:hypothetical protein
MVSIKVLKANGETKFVSHGNKETSLVVTSEYNEGDRIVLEYAGEPKYFHFQADDALGESLILVKGNVEFKIPFGEARTSYSPKAFWGTCHYLHVREAADYEIYAYRNQAFNVYDNHDNNASFPHATANVETRNEAVFAARNAIDGVKANSSHGQWPYTSWGINRNPDALIRIDFGTEVEVDKAVIYLRTDFPHDNWWNEVTLGFSDGSEIKANLVKNSKGQEVCFEKRKVTWVEMKNLIKAESESPFPALTQLEIYGKVI